ncbi:hypothetical protein J7438_24795 [Thalassotalea sp. G20_0]|uniref:hypothetical protein n=1 Tax=Thalassotalea sp. G20_0 TaxID=2821093 RepID=UPI001ADB2E86|nr:hypothetical protein [Thalassotalea sp. G20_0]MBO9497278.1 hypothetical protein [Thalassotalea sp. G20_0]
MTSQNKKRMEPVFAIFSRQKMYSDCANNLCHVTSLPESACKEFVTRWVPFLKEFHSNSDSSDTKNLDFAGVANYVLIEHLLINKTWNADNLNRSVCINFVAGIDRLLGPEAPPHKELKDILDREAATSYSTTDIEALRIAIIHARLYPGQWIYSTFQLSPNEVRDKRNPPEEKELTLHFGQYTDLAERFRKANMTKVDSVEGGRLKVGQFSVTRNPNNTFTVRYCKHQEKSLQ